MSLYALDDIDDALDVTRGFLTPVDWREWVKLAVVAFFISGPGGNVSPFQYNFGNGGNGVQPPSGGVPGLEAAPRLWLLVASIIGAILLIGLVFALIGSIMEFVFVESLRNQEVTVRRYWSHRWRQGLRLFAFRIAVGVAVLAFVLLLGGVAYLTVGGLGPGAIVGLILVLLPVLFLLAIVVGLVNGFTTAFVVPIMVLAGGGVLSGWRRLWPTITAQPKQYLAYAVGGFILSIVGGILLALLVGIVALVLLIPFGLFFGLGLGLLTLVGQPINAGLVIVGVVVGMPYLLMLFAAAAIVQVPVQAYLRYYALLVLGDIEPELDLIPDQRAAVREGSTTSTG